MPRPSNLRRRPVPSNLPEEPTKEILVFLAWFEDINQHEALFAYNGVSWRLIGTDLIYPPGSSGENSVGIQGGARLEGNHSWLNTFWVGSHNVAGVWRSKDLINWELSLGSQELDEFETGFSSIAVARGADGRYWGFMSVLDLPEPIFSDTFILVNDNEGEIGEWDVINQDFGNWRIVSSGNQLLFGDFTSIACHPTDPNIVVLYNIDLIDGPGLNYNHLFIVTTDGVNFQVINPFPEIDLGFRKPGQSAAGFFPQFHLRFDNLGTLYAQLLTRENDDTAEIRIASSATPWDANSWTTTILETAANSGQTSQSKFSFTPVGKRIFALFYVIAQEGGFFSSLWRHESGNSWSQVDIGELGQIDATGNPTSTRLSGIHYEEDTDNLYLLAHSNFEAKIYVSSGPSFNSWRDISLNWSSAVGTEELLFSYGEQVIWGSGISIRKNVNRPPST